MLHDELQKVIVANREMRSAKPFRFSRRQKQLLSEFEKDAQDSAIELPARIAPLDDAALLNIALRTESQQLETESKLYAVFREEDKSAAERILAFRRETIRIITDFILHSEFKGRFQQVASKSARTQREPCWRKIANTLKTVVGGPATPLLAPQNLS